MYAANLWKWKSVRAVLPDTITIKLASKMNDTIKRNGLFNPNGDTDLRLRRMIGGNSTNLNDFNNVKYAWTSNWYRQAMNNFWIPEEINLSQDIKDYPHL